MTKLMPFHLNIIDVYNGDIAYALPFCTFLFCNPIPDRICTCWSIYVIKCCWTKHHPRKRPAVAFRYGIDCMIFMSSDVVPLRGNLPKSMSFFQFELFMWSSITSLRCDVDIPLVLLEISFSRAQSVSIVLPSICWPPLMKLGEYLGRQVSWCPWIWKRPIPNLISRTLNTTCTASCWP